MRRIGVLGGMGPEATVLFQSRLIAAVAACDDADHVPLLVDMLPQVPSRIAHLVDGSGADPSPVLAAMARRLEAAGAEALAMPCNTAHHYAPAIRSAVAVPLLDMVALSAAGAHDTAAPGAPVGVLGSPALARVGVFDDALAAWGRRTLHPSDGDACLAAIRAVKAGRDPASARAAIARAAVDLASRGAGAILVACTEFSIHADAAHGAAPVIDTLDVLTLAAVRFAGAVPSTRRPGAASVDPEFAQCAT